MRVFTLTLDVKIMELKLGITKTVQENAAYYYDQAKETKKKLKGLEKAIEDTKKEIERAEKEQHAKEKNIKIKKEKKWYEKYHWFFTSQRKLAIGGRSAQQNDQLFAKHIEPSDLFFHADIQGGSVFILKEGVAASEDELKEVAQSAASFSNAWKNGNASVDVYAVKKEQLSKHASSGYVPTGGFAITGERRWFKHTSLGLQIGIGLDGVEVVPLLSKRVFEKQSLLFPDKSGKEKGVVAKLLAKKWNISVDEVLTVLPNGKSRLK